MDIPVTAAKTGRRRYLTLIMIFITVVICYVDRANLAVASAHIQEEFGITKAEMGYVFSAFAWLYTLCQIPGGWFLDRVGSRLTYFIAIFGWSVATLFQGFATGLMSLIGLRAITGVFEAPAFPTNNRMVTSWFPEHERASAVGFYTSGQFVGLAFLTPLLIWIQEMLSWHWVFIVTGGIGIVWSLIWFKVYQPPRQTKSISKAELDYIRDGGGLVDGDAQILPDPSREAAAHGHSKPCRSPRASIESAQPSRGDDLTSDTFWLGRPYPQCRGASWHGSLFFSLACSKSASLDCMGSSCGKDCHRNKQWFKPMFYHRTLHS